MKSLNLEILTPKAAFFSGDIQAIRVPGESGSFAVLHNHAPIISMLASGPVKITLPDSSTREFQIPGGVIEVLDNQVVVLAEDIVQN